MGRITLKNRTANAKKASPLAQHIGSEVLKLRQRDQISIRELGQRAGLSYAFLCDLENGKMSIGVESLWALSQAFGVSVGHFFRRFQQPGKGE